MKTKKMWWKATFGIKRRNSTVELAKFGLASLVFFTHIMAFTSMQVDHRILARTFRQLGAMSTLAFAAISGYYLIGKGARGGRWLKVLFTMSILFMLNWIMEVIGLSIRGYVWVGSATKHKIHSAEFWGSAIGRHGWLSQLVIGNDIHWYMWQFAIAMAIFPIISVGLVKMNKKGYLAFGLGFLALNVLVKIVVLANLPENTLGGFLGFYGRNNAMAGADGAPYSGYSWTLLLFMMIMAGWFKLHYKGKSIWGTSWMGAALIWSIIIAIIWKYSNHDISSYSSARANGYPGPYKTVSEWNAIDTSTYSSWLKSHTGGTMDQYIRSISAGWLKAHHLKLDDYSAFAKANPGTIVSVLRETNTPADSLAYKNWFAKQYVVTDSYGITWIGTFLEGGNYIPVAAIMGSFMLFVGIIHLPETNLKIGWFLGGISYAYYFMHMDAMSWTWELFVNGFGVPLNSKGLINDSSSYGFMYIAFMIVSWIIAIPYGVLGTYGTRVGMNLTQKWWDKVFPPKKKAVKVIDATE